MKWLRKNSLRRTLIIQLLLCQIGVLMLAAVLLIAFLVKAGLGGVVVDPEVAEIAARAIERGADGRLKLVETDELHELRQSVPDIWFVARDEQGNMISHGPVPEPYRMFGMHLDKVAFADIRDAVPPYSLAAVVRRASGPAGEFNILAGGRMFSIAYIVLVLSNLLMIPFVILLVLITVVSIPWIVGRSLSSLSMIVQRAGKIDVDRRGDRLPEAGVPTEVQPLVQAVNGALQRLDEGYERQQRFMLDAAHELRTPIAILQTRLETMPESAFRNRLMVDAGRIAALAEQMLDLQRLDHGRAAFVDVNLVSLCRQVAADLAPLAIADGYELSFEASEDRVIVKGDASALERAVVNLVQNAIEHGGQRGLILVRVCGTGLIEVSDQGTGIPFEERERIFEPFHRLQPRDRGAGLGLNLVREIVGRHGGHVSVSDAPGGGACFSIALRIDPAGSGSGNVVPLRRRPAKAAI
ncbi:MAG: HAMP domain-containing histidine kinase [Mesorhizobium sp.]|uniref:sensor histidine kinase n=1 Tax=Mesorhizobium sp. TaxID=1871066 RepID=UPI001AD20473|nr:HAMP domain-containing sensor histidine kinase [Mesorhizobium sp.]MBN9216534.1 HAMP domain-containing histidine kinase [Mesorhizobium sp.]